MSNELSNTHKISQLVQEKQFYWWLGHVCVVMNGIIYFSSVLSFYSNTMYYKRAYMGALLSHAIVIYNSLKSVHKNIGTHLLCDENAHYFVMALYWYSASPITVTLIPFFIYSLFHAFKYTQTLMSLFIPEKEKESLAEKLDQCIKYMTENVHTLAMQHVAHIEVIIIPCRLIIGVLMLHTSILSIIIFVHFLRLRYYLSKPTKEAVGNLTFYLDRWLLSQVHQNTLLSILSKLYVNFKRFMIRYGYINKSA